jgi:8-oxo-dGDP phosphatase
MVSEQVNLNTVAAALVVVAQAGRLLLIQEAKPVCRGTWFLPGGRMAPGESILETALREVNEESGLEVELTGLLYVDQLVDALHSDRPTRLRFVFAGRPAGGRLKEVADEHSLRAAWFSPAEIEGLALRSPFVQKMVALWTRPAAQLPMSCFYILSAEERRQERP